jgi:Zn-dependent M28 family amino/carboxypeptidase
MQYSGSADVTAVAQGVDLQLPPAPAPNSSTSACEPEDFIGFTPGNIAIVQRGACSFAQKALNAEAAGAVGVVIFNEGQDGRTASFLGTLGDPGVSIPVVGAAFDVGVELAAGGVIVRMFVDAISEFRTTSNVLAQSPHGDPENVVMVGAHLDSVAAGTGIQDNGSGSAAILEVAEQMAKVKPRNQLRFAWWGAEEAGLVGSTAYVNGLTDAEIEDIALYLNFDMIGSPNFVYFIYDGDDSDGVGAGPGPEGSAQIEKFYDSFYEARGLPYKGTDFSGRSDYGPFIAVGIPAGGLFTGAEGVKTDEEAALWGGTAGDQYDPCYHLACDTFDNISLEALDVNSDAVAASVLTFGMNTVDVNGEKGKGNFELENRQFLPNN